MTEHSSTGETAASAAESACHEGVAHALSVEDVRADVETLAALGSETRYEALRLVASTPGGTCGCELEPALGVSQGAVSQALSRLRDAGLVSRRKEGRWRYYETTPRADRLLAVLDETRPDGTRADETAADGNAEGGA